MLFLKRLENDGAQIVISKADRDLFRIIATQAEDEAEKELESAIQKDHFAGGMTTEEAMLKDFPSDGE